jgi:hypothetical protein
MRFIIILTALIMLSCSSGQVKTKAVQTDTLKATTVIVNNDTAEVEEDQSDWRQELINEYSREILIDTTITATGKTYKVLLRHYCTWDSGIIVPAKYNFDTNKDFRTHNFQSELTLIENGDTAFKKIITKADFNPLLYTELKSYATLYHPVFEIQNDSIRVFYSISIPVTDVGIGAAIKLDSKGNFSLEK